MTYQQKPAETDVNELINAHANRLNNRYNCLMNYYLGKHSILRKLAKAKGKPDNRLVINFAKELVDNEVGFFAGTPVKFDYDDNGQENQELDQRIADFVAINDLTDTIAELAKQVDIFGRSYTLLYQDEDSNTRVAPVDPRNAFVVYGTQIGAPIEYAVYYTQRQRNGAISGTLYTKNAIVTFHGSANAGIQYDEVDAIYTKSNVANFNDDVFGNASSTALEFKLQSMSNVANMKERKFKLSIRQLFKLAFAIGATLPLDMTGELAKNVKATFRLEIEAKQYLINNADVLKLSDEEVQSTINQLKNYQNERSQ